LGRDCRHPIWDTVTTRKDLDRIEHDAKCKKEKQRFINTKKH
jgi:hypothetical protein